MANLYHQESSLLNLAIAINYKYKDISRLSGEDFNLFRILNLQSSEVRLHSAFLGNLLNPKGTHGQGEIFLNLFVRMFAFKEVEFRSASARVEIEKHIGVLNENKTEGGRIDLLITDSLTNQIIIENKIYAPDQVNQLLRYYNYNPAANLFYLCLNRNEVPGISKGDLAEKKYRVITYEKDLINWLTECKKEVVDQPIVREGLTQYMNLIKYLTGHSTNQVMNKELVETINSSYERFEAAFNIANALDNACEDLLKKFEIMVKEIATELELHCDFGINLTSKYNGISFWRENWKVLSIDFQFQAKDTKLYYGLHREIECLDTSNTLDLQVKGIFDPLKGQSSTWWPFYKMMDSPLDNWSMNMKEPWLAIIDGSIKNIFKEKVLEVLSYADQIEGI